MKTEYDMVVIGGGAAGLVAAGMSALIGAKTALIEENQLGGDCTWTGCIPSKTLLHAGSVAQQLRTGTCGIAPVIPQIDFGQVMGEVRRIRKEVYERSDAPPRFERIGVEVMRGRARFTDPHTVDLGARRLSSRYFVIATGSRARRPSFAVECLTNESIFEIDELPKRLLVIGAGPVGIEMAQAFQRLGSKVAVVAPGARILNRDDLEVTDILHKRLEGEGVQFHLGRRVSEVQANGAGFVATLDDGTAVECDRIFAALGREANVEDLGLDKAGVKLGPKGIAVDAHCRTSQRHIYASGDVTGLFQFTHMAEHMSKVAVSNALLKMRRKVDEKHLTWCTYTDPEVARLGAGEYQLRERDVRFVEHRLEYNRIDRAATEGRGNGLIKVFARTSGEILGATVVGVHAGEMICEYALAMKNGLKLRDIADTIHPYPTYLLGARQTADEWYMGRLKSPLLGIVRAVFGYRGSTGGGGGNGS